MTTTEPVPGPTALAVLSQALAWFDAGEAVVLITLTRTWSSAPVRPGALLASTGDGARAGEAFGAEIDAALFAAATDSSDAELPRSYVAVVDDASAQRAGLPCGGKVEARLERLSDGSGGQVALLRELIQAMVAPRGVVLCTRLSDGRRVLVGVDDPADTELAAEALRASAADSTRVVAIDAEPVLLQVFNPPLRLFVIGAVQIARALVTAARLVGFNAIVIDPRPGFADAALFDDVRCITEPPGSALRQALLDRRSAVVTLSHDPAVDDPALACALNSRAFYVAALGSQKTHEARLRRLQEREMVPAAVCARLRGPAGLPLGAIGPAEIAASIVAELVGALRRPQARFRLDQ